MSFKIGIHRNINMWMIHGDALVSSTYLEVFLRKLLPYEYELKESFTDILLQSDTELYDLLDNKDYYKILYGENSSTYVKLLQLSTLWRTYVDSCGGQVFETK